MQEIVVPFTSEKAIKALRAGMRVSLTGSLIVMRDAAHHLLYEQMKAGEPLPLDLTNEVVFYAGPTPAKANRAVGAIGPTTSARMDRYTPFLLEQGLKGMIGKGKRSEEVKRAIVHHKAVYFVAIGGIAALLSQRVTSESVIAFAHLGTEAIRRITVEKFPCIVVNDIYGNDFYIK